MPEEKTSTAVEETPTDAAAEANETAEESGVKEAIYMKIDEWVKNKTGKRIGKTGGRILFDIFTAEVFAAATKNEMFRFNGGFGSLHVREYQEGERRLPSGQMTQFGKRHKLRYEQGVVVTALVANGGNLEEALKVRGSRGKEKEETTEVKAEKATKPAKSAKTEKPKPVAKKQDTAPAEATDGEIDLA